MSRQDIAHQVSLTLGDHVADFDIDGIVTDLIAAHDGNLNSIDDFESESYWAIVETHDTTATTEATATLNVEPSQLIHGKGYEIAIESDGAEILAPVSLDVLVGADHDNAKDRAESALADAGWKVVSDWQQLDSCYTVTVRRA